MPWLILVELHARAYLAELGHISALVQQVYIAVLQCVFRLPFCVRRRRHTLLQRFIAPSLQLASESSEIARMIENRKVDRPDACLWMQLGYLRYSFEKRIKWCCTAGWSGTIARICVGICVETNVSGTRLQLLFWRNAVFSWRMLCAEVTKAGAFRIAGPRWLPKSAAFFHISCFVEEIRTPDCVLSCTIHTLTISRIITHCTIYLLDHNLS